MTDEEMISLMKRELGCILASGENVNNNVFDWIQKNLQIDSSSERQRLFMRALVTVVVQSTIQGEAESCRMNHDLLTVRMAILKRYINNDNHLELQAIYAVQALNQSLGNPARLLGHIFNVFYDEDVVPEETFHAWKESSDPNENLGRGVALKSVTSFFDWLRDADDECASPSYRSARAACPPGDAVASVEPKMVIQRIWKTIKLSTAGENAWTKRHKDMPSDEEEAKTKDLFKKINALLNKLTPNNFQKLKAKAMQYPIDTEERLKGVIDMVFGRAISESLFRRTYAELCRDLSQLKVPAASGNGMVQFRTLLINRCQKEFEKEKSDEQEEKLEREEIAKLPADQRTSALEDLELKVIKNKQRMLGNILFIGELFKLQMLIEQIMHDCIFKLLCSKDDESLECMSHLMSTTGKILDYKKAKNRMDQHFHLIRNLISNKKTSARVRFMLQDVIDLRARHWLPRQANHNNPITNKPDQPQQVGPPQPEGWNTVTCIKPARVVVDLTKFRVTKSQSTFGQGSMPTGGRRSKPKKVIQRVSQTIKLNTAGENALSPDEEEAKTMDLFKKFNALLNKLTPRNFQKLKAKAMDYPIDTEERLKGVIDLVYQKAINESLFSRTYAELCRDLSQLKVPAASGNGMVQFRTLLINRCQKEFEKEKSNEQEEKLEREKIAKLPADQRTAALEDLELKLIKNKQRMLGNIRFIGELFKLQMLIEQIMHDCIFKLLCSKDDESLECVSHLMITIGKILDHQKAKNRIDQYIHQISNLISNKKMSARVRFMLQDVTDLRARHWVPRRANNNPKTIEQIRQEFKREEEQKKMEGMAQIQAAAAAPPPRMSRNKRDQPQRQSIDDDIQLGPGRQQFGGWSRGSSGGSAKGQQQSQEPQEPRQSNRFTMLADDRRPRGPRAAEARGRGPQGLGGKQSSLSRERDQNNRERQFALAEVQRITGARQSNSREDREADFRRGKPEPVPVPIKKPVKQVSPSPELSEDVFEKKALAMVEEYLSMRDIEEVIMCLNDLKAPSLMHVFVRAAVNCTLEKNPQARDLVGMLFHKLLKAGHLTKDKFKDGVKEVLMYADDMALDIPRIWMYLGEIIGATFRDNSLSLKLLADMMEPVRAVDKAGDLMAEILRTAVKLNGANAVGEMWQLSGFTWDMFLPVGGNVKEFVNKKELDFTLITASTCSSTTNSGGDANANNVMTDEEMDSLMKRELGCILASGENVNNNVFDWIQKNLQIGSSSERQRLFIRALVTVVIQSTVQGEAESCRMNHDLLTVRMAILKRYINSDNYLELQALYAVQALNQSLGNPPRLLGHVFNVLYDEDVIPEETFHAWKESSDPNENLGKGVALKSVTSFFDWLRDADDELAK